MTANVFRSLKHIARNPCKVTEENIAKLFMKAYEGRLKSES
jgi:hypothetical protein